MLIDSEVFQWYHVLPGICFRSKVLAVEHLFYDVECHTFFHCYLRLSLAERAYHKDGGLLYVWSLWRHPTRGHVKNRE